MKFRRQNIIYAVSLDPLFNCGHRRSWPTVIIVSNRHLKIVAITSAASEKVYSKFVVDEHVLESLITWISSQFQYNLITKKEAGNHDVDHLDISTDLFYVLANDEILGSN